MSEGKKLDNIVILGTYLMIVGPSGPVEREVNDSEIKFSYCQDCLNKDEGRCLGNGLTRRLPSGMCGNYEPRSEEGLDEYNVTFGPVPEGMSMGPKLITMRSDLEYIEADFVS